MRRKRDCCGCTDRRADRLGCGSHLRPPGDGINGIMESLRTHQDKIRFVHVRHEEAAAFMACGYAKFTGRLGVCLATSGPGGIHLLNGLYDAKLDRSRYSQSPGMAFHDLIGTFTQQDVELDKLFMDVAVFNQRIMGPTHVENITDLACAAHRLPGRFSYHLSGRSPGNGLSDERSKRNMPHHTSDVGARSASPPGSDGSASGGRNLERGEEGRILAGRGALDATDELSRWPNYSAHQSSSLCSAKAAVPDDSPYTTGGIGLLGTKPSQDAIEDCDTLFMVGTSFPYIEFMPKPKQARGVQIELDPKRIGLRYPVEVGLVGDSRNTLRELIPLLKRKEDSAFPSRRRRSA